MHAGIPSFYLSKYLLLYVNIKSIIVRQGTVKTTLAKNTVFFNPYDLW